MPDEERTEISGFSCRLYYFDFDSFTMLVAVDYEPITRVVAFKRLPLFTSTYRLDPGSNEFNRKKRKGGGKYFRFTLVCV